MANRVLSFKHLSPREGIPSGAVRIDRRSKWGNPFVIGKDGTREEVIEKYRAWFPSSGLDASELAGKDLICWCAPEACHGDVLIELANSEEKVDD